MMNAHPLTKADMTTAIQKSLRFTVLELPLDLKDHAKAERLQLEVRNLLTRARSTSVAVIVLDMPKETR